jgi:hypothetical protein
MLSAGSHSLSVTFTPLDTENYTSVKVAVSVAVTKLTPATITWHSPSAIAYGAPLGDTQLNATASVPGTFVYTPAAGDVLAVGRHRLSASFTPADSGKYAAAHDTVAFEVEGLQHMDSLLAASTHTPFIATEGEDLISLSDAHREGLLNGTTTSQSGEIETRTYKGAVYEKGEDGKWHLQRK